MAFTRKFLIDNGVPEDKVDAIMAERNRTLNDYIPKADVQVQIDAALAEAANSAPALNVVDSAEYKALQAENTKIKALQTDDFANVKAPYRDIVWERLDHSEKHKPYAEQLTGLAEAMPDLFSTAPSEPETSKPRFSSADQGTMPTGTAKNTLEGLWFGKK